MTPVSLHWDYSADGLLMLLGAVFLAVQAVFWLVREVREVRADRRRSVWLARPGPEPAQVVAATDRLITELMQKAPTHARVEANEIDQVRSST
jgi:hypothetical protein